MNRNGESNSIGSQAVVTWATQTLSLTTTTTTIQTLNAQRFPWGESVRYASTEYAAKHNETGIWSKTMDQTVFCFNENGMATKHQAISNAPIVVGQVPIVSNTKCVCVLCIIIFLISFGRCVEEMRVNRNWGEWCGDGEWLERRWGVCMCY